MVNHVDREWIRRWMTDEADTPAGSCDDWDAKAIDMCDSISVVVEGKQRKRLDRWRAACELLNKEFLAETGS